MSKRQSTKLLPVSVRQTSPFSQRDVVLNTLFVFSLGWRAQFQKRQRGSERAGVENESLSFWKLLAISSISQGILTFFHHSFFFFANILLPQIFFLTSRDTRKDNNLFITHMFGNIGKICAIFLTVKCHIRANSFEHMLISYILHIAYCVDFLWFDWENFGDFFEWLWHFEKKKTVTTLVLVCVVVVDVVVSDVGKVCACTFRHVLVDVQVLCQLTGILMHTNFPLSLKKAVAYAATCVGVGNVNYGPNALCCGATCAQRLWHLWCFCSSLDHKSSKASPKKIKFCLSANLVLSLPLHGPCMTSSLMIREKKKGAQKLLIKYSETDCPAEQFFAWICDTKSLCWTEITTTINYS